MPIPLIECVPNFSEARRPEVIADIRQAIQSVADCTLLDQHSDLDHNRTVLTFVGPPEVVAEAAFRAIQTAARLINLDMHQGAHPRIGATDVVPFVPISGVSMQECVELARRLGRRVGEELGIPVYLYEQAATRPERQNLENIRRGEYETLREEIGRLPERQPDFGPSQMGTAGATVIGARHFLIAFNVYLNSHDVEIAKKVAKAIRHSSGGLRYVKALGLLVEGRAQVSMNLTNFRSTPLARVVESIRREAARFGTSIHHSELVGLIPQEALTDAAQWYLQLDQFDGEQVLERRLAVVQQRATTELPLSVLPPADFVTALAADSPAPGGGSAAAYTGALGAALVGMTARLTLGRKKYAGVENEMQAIAVQSDSLRQELLVSVERDAAAFEEVMLALRLPKESDDERRVRDNAVQEATLKATLVPLGVIRRISEVLELAARAAESGNLNAITDVGTGAELALAALRGASLNVQVNLTSLADPQTVSAFKTELSTLEKNAEDSIGRVRAALATRGGLSPA